MAEVVTSGTTKPAKTAAKTKKAASAHLLSFLVQACSTLPDYVLVFAKVGCCSWDNLSLLVCGVKRRRQKSLLSCPVFVKLSTRVKLFSWGIT